MSLFRRTITLSSRQRGLLVAVATYLSGQLYFSVWTEGFRISASGIVFPLLLLTIRRESHRPYTGLFTGIMVATMRLWIGLSMGDALLPTLISQLGTAVFYLCYDTVLCLLLKDRRQADYRTLWACLFFADLLSNVLNYLVTSQFSAPMEVLVTLSWVALFRAASACFILWGVRGYHQLLLREEHELRYRRLFLMTANLKNELYFLKKDAEEAEQVMVKAYRLYEQLEGQDVPGELRELALSIARDVHEIKKDNLRIISGLESEVAEAYDHETMAMSDLLNILSLSTQQMLGEQRAEILLTCSCPVDVPVMEHYRVMSVLKNLVTNAVEAIQSDTGEGTIGASAQVEGDKLLLTVSDSGPGISRRGQKLLFRVGYSTKFDPNTGNISRGVGLPAVQFIVEEMGGRLDVESEPGRGTTFRVELPLETVTGGIA